MEYFENHPSCSHKVLLKELDTDMSLCMYKKEVQLFISLHATAGHFKVMVVQSNAFVLSSELFGAVSTVVSTFSHSIKKSPGKVFCSYRTPHHGWWPWILLPQSKSLAILTEISVFNGSFS